MSMDRWIARIRSVHRVLARSDLSSILRTAPPSAGWPASRILDCMELEERTLFSAAPMAAAVASALLPQEPQRSQQAIPQAATSNTLKPPQSVAAGAIVADHKMVGKDSPSEAAPDQKGDILLDTPQKAGTTSLTVNLVHRAPRVADATADNAEAANQDAAAQDAEVALIDTHLPDSGVLVQAVKSGSQLFLYDSSHDSAHDVLARVAGWAEATGSKIESLSILSHGVGGAFELGGQWISNATLDQTAADWQRLGRSLVEGANLELFGCSVAGPASDGQLLLDRIAVLTGADGFASTDLTGQGGDWQLEAASAGDMAELDAGVAGPFDDAMLGEYHWTLSTPIITTTSSLLAYTENDAATVIEPGLTNTGGSANDLGATVTISTNYAKGQDVLAFTDKLGITGSWDARTGVLTLSGATTRENYEAALRSVTYANTSDAPSALTRTVTFAVTADGDNGTGSGTRDISVAAVNDAPVLSGANNFTAINEDGITNGGNLVSTLIWGRVADADMGALSGIAVTAVDNANGTWQYTTDGTTDGGSSWTAFGTPSTTTARLLAANAATRVRFVPNANWNGMVTSGFTFRAWDQTTGTAGSTADLSNNGGTAAFSSGTAMPSIAVTPVNDPPVLSGIEGTTLAYTNNTPAMAITTMLVVSDVDNANLAGATIRITGNYQSGQDVLAFTNTANITGNWNTATGTLTLNGNDSVANYQAALRSVTYRNTSVNPSAVTRTVSFTVIDESEAHSLTADPKFVEATPDGAGNNFTLQVGSRAIDAGVTLVGFTDDITGAQRADGSWDLGAYERLAHLLGTSTSFESSAIPQTIYVDATGGNDANDGQTPGTAWQTLAKVNATRWGEDDHILFKRGESWTGTLVLQDSGTSGHPITIGSYGDVGLERPTFRSTVYDLASETWVHEVGMPENVWKATVPAAYPTPDIALKYDDATNDYAVRVYGDVAEVDSVNEWFLGWGGTAYETYIYHVGDPTGALTTCQYVAAVLYLDNVSYVDVEDLIVERGERNVFVLSDAGSGSTAINLTRILSRYGTINFSCVGEPATPLTYVTHTDCVAQESTVSHGFKVGSDVAEVAGGTSYVTYSNCTSWGNKSCGFQIGRATNVTLTDCDAYLNSGAFVPTEGSNGFRFGSTQTAILQRCRSYSNAEYGLLVEQSTGAAKPSNLTIENCLIEDNGFGVYLKDIAAGSYLRLYSNTIANNGSLGSWAGGIAYGHSSNLLGTVETKNNIVYNARMDGQTLVWRTDAMPFSEDSDYNLYYNVSGRAFVINGASEYTLAQFATYVTATRGLADSNVQTRDIAVTPVNVAPVLSGIEATALAYNENDPATAITATLTVSDADNANLAGARIQITGNYQSDQDVLDFTNTAGISGSWNAATGTLTLSGSNSVANYQAALRSVTYRNSSVNPSGLTRTVSVTVNDGLADSNVQTRSIAVTPVNDPPVIAGPGLQFAQSGKVFFSTATGNPIVVSDVDAGTHPIQVTIAATNGLVTLTRAEGLVLALGDGQAAASLVFTGTIADVNAALDGMCVCPTAPSARVEIMVNDQGFSGAGGPKTASASFWISQITEPIPRNQPTEPIPELLPQSPPMVPRPTSTSTSPPTPPTPASPAPSPTLATAAGLPLAVTDAWPSPQYVLAAIPEAEWMAQGETSMERIVLHGASSKGRMHLAGRVGWSQSANSPMTQGGELSCLAEGNPLRDELDSLNKQKQSGPHLQDFFFLGSAITVTAGLAAGYVLWMIRTRLWTSNIQAQMPAWRLVDPQVVLSHREEDRLGERDEEEAETLESPVDSLEKTPETADTL
ncbi:MAG: DUF4347 domain-containing protein [Pirellulales bacterium]